MSEREQNQDDRITRLEDGQARILELLEPIAETYTVASKLGKWGMGLLVFISISLGILLGVKNLIK